MRGSPFISDLEPWQRDFLEIVLDGEYYVWAGVELLEIAAGRARLRLQPSPVMLTPWGSVNGGVVNGLLELPSFLSLLPSLEEKETAVTSDIFIQNMKPIPGDAELVLEGKLLRRGRTMAWCEAAAIVDGTPRTLARITKTILTG